MSGDMQTSEALNGCGTGGKQGCVQGSRQIGEDSGASKNELAVKKSVLHWEGCCAERFCSRILSKYPPSADHLSGGSLISLAID